MLAFIERHLGDHQAQFSHFRDKGMGASMGHMIFQDNHLSSSNLEPRT